MGGIAPAVGTTGFLLDTHAFLWAARNPSRLGKRALAIIEDPSQRLYLSAVSAYEITNKHRLGKLDGFDDIIANYSQVARQLGALDLPINFSHAYQAGRMDWPHRDPFDRILATQAAMEHLTLITNDLSLRAYSFVETVW
jgi:PIN domain nuclease of toxin-antitoxin system